MEITEGSVEYQTSDGINYEHALFTYNEQEKQENEINKANAKLVFNFKYLTIPRENFLLGLNGNELLIYSFLSSRLSTDGNRFYFGNDTLAGIFNVSDTSISDILKDLITNDL